MLDRIQIAGEAGFTGFGFVLADLEGIASEGMWGDVQAALDAAGITWIELEILQGWWVPPDGERREYELQKRLLFDASDRLEAFRLKVAGDVINLEPPDLDSWAKRLNELCREADDHGLRVAVEFLKFSNIPDLATAADLVKRADHPGAGVMIDSWHVDRSGTSPEEVAKLPLEYLGGVELDDGSTTPVGTAYEDTVNNRVYLGRGEFRNRELIEAVASVGWSGPWGVEIISVEHRSRELRESLPDVIATTRAALLSAGVG